MQEKILNEQPFITTKEKLGCTEEYIIVKNEKSEDNLLLNYALSNSFEDIIIAIYARTGKIVNLDNTFWHINSKLSVSVKHLMNNQRVNYSMTILGTEPNRSIIVNMRVGDKWFLADYNEIDGEFLGIDFIYKGLLRFL
jgi:hypothetical protein